MKERINISLDKDVADDIRAMAEVYNMNFSETIAFMFDLLDELNTWNVLIDVASEEYDELYYTPSKRELLKAARKCSVTRD